MKKRRIDGQETQLALLSSATELFAKKGFWETTNADICKKANANIASINYHFGSKENLYVESWKYVFRESMEKYPPDGRVAPDASVQERLYGRIFALMQRISDTANYDLDIVHREMAAPTGLLSEVMDEAMKPIEYGFKSIIRELLGNCAGKKEVEFCHMTIMGQCFGPMLHLRHRRSGEDFLHHKEFHVDFDVEDLAMHITKFSLDGITGVRERLSGKVYST